MDIITEEPTLEEMATDYVKLLNAPANGWGQHVHPRYGISHKMLLTMQQRFGREATNKAIDAAFHQRRVAHLQPTT